MAGESKPSGRARIYRQVGPYLGLGVELIAPVLFCMAVGWWLDVRLETSPILMLIGAFVGAGVGFYSFFRTVLRLQGGKKAGAEDDEQRPEETE